MSSKTIVRQLNASSLAVSVTLAVVSFVLGFFPAKVSYAYEKGVIIRHSWHDVFENVTIVIFAVVFILSTASVIICIRSKLRSKEKIAEVSLSCLTFAVGSFLIIFSNIAVVGLWQESDYDPACYEFTDGLHTIVIEEESFLLYGGGTVFQIKENNDAVIIGHISTDDGGRNNGEYDIDWNKSYAEITYNTFVSGDSRDTIKVEFV